MIETTETPALIPALPGYRALSDVELRLIDEIKAHEQETLRLLSHIRSHLARQDSSARINATSGADTIRQQADRELVRLYDAEPIRWHSIAKTEIQQGFMALVRSVAQPRTQA